MDRLSGSATHSNSAIQRFIIRKVEKMSSMEPGIKTIGYTMLNERKAGDGELESIWKNRLLFEGVDWELTGKTVRFLNLLVV